MSEFQLAGGIPPGVRSGPPSQHGTPVEWYQSSGASTSYASPGPEYSFAPPSTGGYISTNDNFTDEAPLLEELGIDISGILRKSRGILAGRFSAADVEELDMGGPLVFAAALACVHVLVGKLHFGVILGWSVAGSTAVWFVVNNMAGMDSPDTRGTGLYDCTCLLGYGMLPMVLHALLCLLVPRGILPLLTAALAVLWAAFTASKMFVKRSPALEEQRSVIAYPCLLMYMAFAMLTLY